MNELLPIFILLPMLGYGISLLIPEKKEDTISWTAFGTVVLHQLFAIVYTVFWLLNNHHLETTEEFTLLRSGDYVFDFTLMFDKVTAVYLLTGAFLTSLVTVYSRYYLHREKGYKRFFNTILFFYMGYNIAIFSGNFETLFIGWEILGIASFLLIAFYRDRYLPVKNAVKIFSIYRIGDVGLILAMWMSHHLWHESITFEKLDNYQLVSEQLQSHSLIGVFISLMILLSAAAKSAQLPFSSWLPRAMEGPTPSSAIFYGSLSVHLGVFLLLRTFPFWEHQFSVRILIGLLGLATTLISVGIARVQSSVKSQLAYASIAQIGLIFIEVAAGWNILALVHFAGNAFLRTYQLLVSPSIVSYLIKEQFYKFVPRQKSFEGRIFSNKFEYALYILCIKEWNLDAFMYQYLWNPLKQLGKRMDFLNLRILLWFFIPAYLIGLFFLHFADNLISPIARAYLPVTFAFFGLIMVLKAFSERKLARLSWVLVILNHFWIALAVSYNEHFDFYEIYLYLSGVVVSGVAGYWVLNWISKAEIINLDRFHGHVYEHPVAAFLFFVCCLGLSGFPITPTFIGEDLIFSHIHENQVVLASFVALSFIIDGLAIMRIYARVFLGPHIKNYHSTAYRSS
jgi:NADH-quinone oxidoreductase subunit L